MTEGVIILLLGELFSIIGLLITNILQNRSMKKEMKELKEHQNENYLATLRLTVVSEEMPITERIIAGKKYIEKGGNGEVKKIYQRMLNEHVR